MELTPKDKANELFQQYIEIADNIEWTNDEDVKDKTNKFNEDLGDEVLVFWRELAKQCSLIAVDEIIKIKLLWFQKDTEHLDFWQEVKEELLKIK